MKGGTKYGRKRTESETFLFQQLQITLFVARSSRRLLNVREKLPEVFLFGRIHSVKTDTHHATGCATGHDPVQSETLDPNLAARYPKANLDSGAARNQIRGGLYLASSQACIRQVSPDWSITFVDSKFDRHKAFNSGVPATILSPVGVKDIRFERGNSGCRFGRTRDRGHSLCHRSRGTGGRAFDLSHRCEQSFFAVLRRSIAIGL